MSLFLSCNVEFDVFKGLLRNMGGTSPQHSGRTSYIVVSTIITTFMEIMMMMIVMYMSSTQLTYIIYIYYISRVWVIKLLKGNFYTTICILEGRTMLCNMNMHVYKHISIYVYVSKYGNFPTTQWTYIIYLYI